MEFFGLCAVGCGGCAGVAEVAVGESYLGWMGLCLGNIGHGMLDCRRFAQRCLLFVEMGEWLVAVFNCCCDRGGC